MKINETVREAFETAKEKGWHENINPLPELLMKMVTELAEAMEEYRNKTPSFYIKGGKPEGIEIELADCVIRIMDCFGENGWDLERALRVKMDYNKTRSYKHGGKVC
ncbi:MAG TPA: hypothetical protein VI911_11255 [Patescibacteria group bacterium]|nr:hypothetical protein [Patescibacteria group bacterium]